MSRILLIMVLAIGMGACASNANDVANNDGSEASTAESGKSKKHCYYEKSTGSRLGTRICKEVQEASGE